MKTKLTIVASVLICAICGHPAQAQESSGAATTNETAAVRSQFIAFEQNVQSNRSITIAVYPMYAPKIVVNGKPDTFGLGIALLTPASVIPALEGTVVGNHAFAGLRFDYLAHQAFASTIGVGVRGNIQVLKHDFTFTAQGGMNIPFSGFGLKNGDLGGMLGSGVYTDIYRFSLNADLGLQVSVEKWTQFPGMVWLGGPVFNWTF